MQNHPESFLLQLFDLQNEGVFSPQSSSVKSEEPDYNRAPKWFSSYYSADPFCPASILFTQLISFNEPPESDWQNMRGIHSSINRKKVLFVLESAPPGNAPDAQSTPSAGGAGRNVHACHSNGGVFPVGSASFQLWKSTRRLLQSEACICSHRWSICLGRYFCQQKCPPEPI